MPSGIKTPTKKKLEVYRSYAQTGSYRMTEKETGVNEKTVKKIIQENTEEYQQEKDRFIEKTTKIIDKALDRLEQTLNEEERLAINNLSTVIGTLYDKRALAKGESTNNDSITIKMSDDIKELSK